MSLIIPIAQIGLASGETQELPYIGTLIESVFGSDASAIQLMLVAGAIFLAGLVTVRLGRSFDLALCLEVAEHLPAEAGAVLVETLTRHAPAVLFSAAIPGQGGTDHVNEAWPEVWQWHFAKAGFDCHDIIRPAIWADARIEPWYRQNLPLFVRRDAGSSTGNQTVPRHLVHPDILSARLHDLQAVSARLKAAEAEITRLGQTWQDLADENTRLTGIIAGLEADLARGKAALVGMLQSRSWRLIPPLRRLNAALGGRGT